MRSLFPHAVAIVTALTVTKVVPDCNGTSKAAAPTPVITTVASGLTILDVTQSAPRCCSTSGPDDSGRSSPAARHNG